MKRSSKQTPEDRRRIAESWIQDRIKARRDAATSWAPHLDPEGPPPGYMPRGCSVLRGPDGQVKLVWQKTVKEPDPFQTAELVAAGLQAGGLEALPKIPTPEVVNEDLLSVYPLGDPHIGMYAWAPECGECFDLKIAVRQYLAAAALLIPRAPAGTDALIIDLGDFFHADGPKNFTSSGKNQVDVDGRYPKVLEAGINIAMSLTEAALRRHRTVHWWFLRGNHDDVASIALRLAITHAYANNPRVVVDPNPGKFHYMEFGNNLLASTHGDSIKGNRAQKLYEVITSDRREAWGRTKFAKWFVGHVHHDSVTEIGGCKVQTYRTLTPKDAWHTGAGYRSGRDTRLEVFHREFGPQRVEVVDISEVQHLMRRMEGDEL